MDGVLSGYRFITLPSRFVRLYGIRIGHGINRTFSPRTFSPRTFTTKLSISVGSRRRSEMSDVTASVVGAVVVGLAGLAIGYKALKSAVSATSEAGSEEDYPAAAGSMPSKELHSSLPCTDSLHDVITEICRTKLTVSSQGRHNDIQFSKGVVSQMRTCLQKVLPQFTLPTEQNPGLIGSASDGTMIQGDADFDYIVLMIPPDGTFSMQGGQEGYWKLKAKRGLEKTQEWQKLLVGDGGSYFLSPLQVHAFLCGKIPEIMEKLDGKGIDISRHFGQTGPSLKFEVSYNGDYGERRTFDMDFVPCILINGRQLVGKRHPILPASHLMTRGIRKEPETLRWRQSFSTLERDRIASLDKSGGGLSKRVYRIIKLLRSQDHKQPQFRQFSSFIYKNVFLYLLDEYPSPKNWRENELDSRFLNYMENLEAVFSRGELNHYYLLKKEGIKRNLLKPDYPDDQIKEFYNFLKRNNRKGKDAWAQMLKNALL